MSEPVAVLGVGQTSYVRRHPESSAADLIWAAAEEALAAFPGLPEPPIVMAYVTLDGADTALVNLVLGLDLSDIGAAAAGLQRQPRVRVQYVPEPQGRITDFAFVLA